MLNQLKRTFSLAASMLRRVVMVQDSEKEDRSSSGVLIKQAKGATEWGQLLGGCVWERDKQTGNFGEVVHVRLAMDHIVNLPKGSGCVKLKTQSDAEKAQLHMIGPRLMAKLFK